MEARVKQNKICLHLLQKSPFSCDLQSLLWKGDVKPHVEPPERPAHPHAGQGHGCFTHTKLRPNPAADLSPPPGHQMEPPPDRLGRASGTATRSPPPQTPNEPLLVFQKPFPNTAPLQPPSPPGLGKCLWRAGR